MKFIILSIILFFLFRYFNSMFLPAGRPKNDDHLEPVEEDEGEYIDYEEVD